MLLLAAAASLLAGCQTARPGGPDRLADCDKIIARYAKTRSDALSVAEWGARAWDGSGVLLNKNHDGRITLEEWTGQPSRPTDRSRQIGYDSLRRSFERLDRGGKGFLDQADLTRDAAPGFRRLDLNHDGWLTRTECAVILPYPIELV